MSAEIKAFYYPEFAADQATVAKAILLFDELHFMDRPGLSFLGSGGQIGMPSPVRPFLPNFKDAGIPVVVHNAPSDPRHVTYLEPLISADVNDLTFIRKFQLGLKNDPKFLDIQLSPDILTALGGRDKALAMLTSEQIISALMSYGNSVDLIRDVSVRPFIGSSPLDIAKTLLHFAVPCSAKMNFAFSIGAREGFYPFADALTYGDLLHAKYTRAIANPAISGSNIQQADLTVAALDEAVPAEQLETLTIPFAIEFRKKYEGERKEFLDHIASLQQKLASVEPGADYGARLENIVTSEIRPAIRNFRNKCRSIDEKTAIAISATAALTLITVFAGLGWVPVFTGLATIAKSALDAKADERAARRECSVSYILRINETTATQS